MEEEKIKEILDEKQESQQQVHQQKRTFWNNKKTVKGKALSAWLIVMIVIFMLFTFGLGIYFGKEVFSEKKNKNKETKDIEPAPISDKVDEEELQTIAMLYETNYSEFFNPLLITNGIINDLNIDQKTMLVYKYASKKNMTIANPTSCNDGAGLCVGIKIEDFNTILKKYEITNFDASSLKRENDMYIIQLGGDIVAYKINHNLSSNAVNESYIITDKMELMNSATGTKEKEETKEYTFIKSTDGSYSLHSVTTK